MQLLEYEIRKGIIIRGLYSQSSSNHLVICVAGFERTTVEPKFKYVEFALREKLSVFRFDLPGLGLSDGIFSDFTINKAAEDLGEIVEEMKKLALAEKISLIGHSVGCCVITQYLLQNKLPELEKVVFLAPALNQAALFRLWFVEANIKDKEISWENYKNYLDEVAFLESLKGIKETKTSFLNPGYFRENKERDFNQLLYNASWYEKIFVVHGDSDEKVPIASNKKEPNIKVLNGNHDLEKPSMVKQYLNQVVKFLVT